MPNCNCLFLQIIRSIGTDRGTTCETKKYQTVVVQHKTVERNQSTFGPFRIRVSKVREFFYWLDWQTDWQKWVKLKEREREKDKFGERRIHFSLGFLKIKNWFFSSDLAALKNKKNLTAQECEKGKVERERKKVLKQVQRWWRRRRRQRSAIFEHTLFEIFAPQPRLWLCNTASKSWEGGRPQFQLHDNSNLRSCRGPFSAPIPFRSTDPHNIPNWLQSKNWTRGNSSSSSRPKIEKDRCFINWQRQQLRSRHGSNDETTTTSKLKLAIIIERRN